MTKIVFSLFTLSICVQMLSAQLALNLNLTIPDSLSKKHPLAWDISNNASRAETQLDRVELQADTNTYSGFPMLSQTVCHTGQELRKLRISARVKPIDHDSGRAYLYAHTKAGESYIQAISSPWMEKNDAWQQLELFIILDVRVSEYIFGVALEGNGRLWVDEFEVEEVSLQEPELADSLRYYIDTFFSIARSEALGREAIDWDRLERDVLMLSSEANSLVDLHPNLAYAARRINKHSLFVLPQVVRQWRGEDNDEIANRKTFLPSMEFSSGRRINSRTAYISMPGVNSGHEPSLQKFADSLQQLIRELDSPETDSWVLDLRNNTGGNCWPMLAGVGPFLGEGVCGYFMNMDGSDKTAWRYNSQGSFIDTSLVTPLSQPAYTLLNAQARIAVITGPRTGSSGEVVTIAFRAMDHVRSFGQPTAGYSTTNTSFFMPDGAMLLLTISVYGDRESIAYGEEVEPDEIVDQSIDGKDMALERAVEWLNQ
ncbi:MAG: S41 family peptidase [Bacteroidota bacterium]